jgi:hypothetical protein
LARWKAPKGCNWASSTSQRATHLDASDRDGGINLQNWPVFGFKMPDSIGAYEFDGVTYFVTANEGDDRGDANEPGRGDAIRVGDLGMWSPLGAKGWGWMSASTQL